MTNIELETYNAVKMAARHYMRDSLEEARTQAAIAALQGMLARGCVLVDKESMAKTCVDYADALIQELKARKDDK